MAGLTLKETAAASVPTPATDKATVFIDSADGLPKYKNDAGTVASLGGVSDGDKGDITVSASGATFTIDNNAISTAKIADDAVTLAKIADQADQTILGNNTGGSASPVALTASQVRTLLSLVIGTNVQAWDTQLDSLASLTYGSNALKVVRVNAGESGFELATVSAGSGDFVGPASSTDNALVRFDGTTGKLGQNSSGATLSDTFVLTLAGGWIYAPGGTTSLTLDGASNAPTLTASGAVSAEMNLRAYAHWFEDVSGPTKYAGFGTVYGYNALHCASTTRIAWSSSTSARNSTDVNILRAGANALTFGGSGAGGGAVTTRTEINKLVSAIADATATDVFTVTVPNAAHSANVEVTLNGSLGAGGAIGANEATGTIKYNVSIARTAGVNAVATISTGYGSASSSVAGAATITVTGDLSAISGAVGATNTFTIRVTITKGSGSSANHTCTAHAVLLNANATGVTIA